MMFHELVEGVNPQPIGSTVLGAGSHDPEVCYGNVSNQILMGQLSQCVHSPCAYFFSPLKKSYLVRPRFSSSKQLIQPTEVIRRHKPTVFRVSAWCSSHIGPSLSHNLPIPIMYSVLVLNFLVSWYYGSCRNSCYKNHVNTFRSNM